MTVGIFVQGITPQFFDHVLVRLPLAGFGHAAQMIPKSLGAGLPHDAGQFGIGPQSLPQLVRRKAGIFRRADIIHPAPLGFAQQIRQRGRRIKGAGLWGIGTSGFIFGFRHGGP